MPLQVCVIIGTNIMIGGGIRSGQLCINNVLLHIHMCLITSDFLSTTYCSWLHAQTKPQERMFILNICTAYVSSAAGEQMIGQATHAMKSSGQIRHAACVAFKLLKSLLLVDRDLVQ